MNNSPGILVPVEQAIEAVREGRMIIIVDDEDRENEGDLMIAAEKATADSINFMSKHGRGLICLPLSRSRLADLQLPLMVSDNTARFETAFTVSIDAKKGVTTGISASGRPSTRPPNPPTLPGRVISFRSRPGRAASWPGPARPRLQWTSPASPGSTRPRSSAKS
jgi:3,4-dihydroxy 2-butanone 4-phosphate synthase/GTP cyclohydrolase II